MNKSILEKTMNRLEILRDIAKRRGVAMAIVVVVASPALMLWVGIGVCLQKTGEWMRRVAGA